MKKQSVFQSRKLSLHKKVIAPLMQEQQHAVAGGASEGTCQLTKDRTLCQGNTDQYGCTTHSLGIACTVIFCV